VKAYFALKAIVTLDAPHMRRARAAILAAGGAERTNVLSPASNWHYLARCLAAVPVMPIEIMHLPLWFPFHLSKCRTGRARDRALLTDGAAAACPQSARRTVRELFRTLQEQVSDWIRGPYVPHGAASSKACRLNAARDPTVLSPQIPTKCDRTAVAFVRSG